MSTSENIEATTPESHSNIEVAANEEISLTTQEAQTPHIEITPEDTTTEAPVYVAKNFDIDIDFDNYSVSEKRAESIRYLIQQVKGKTWLASLKDWIDAEGQDYYPYGEQTEMGETPSKRIAWESGHALETLEIINDGVDTEIKIDGKRYISLQKLPKGDELLLSQFNPDYTEKFLALENELHANLKIFLKAKADKQKAFQERFKK